MLEVVGLLRDALEIASPSGEEAAVAGMLAERARSFADDTLIDEAGNVVVRVGNGPLRVTFLGHIDTVPGEIEVRQVGDRLYGRGAVDAKGPLCAALAAASILPASVREAVTLTVVGATEEEAPSSRGARFVLASHLPPHLLIVGEPSGWEGITLGYKGRLLLEVEVVKDNSHSAGRESSAADDAVAACQSALAWALEASAGRERLFDTVQASLQRIDSSNDGLEQRCRALIGFRLPPSHSPDEVTRRLAERLPEGLRYRFRGAEHAYRSAKDTRLTRLLRTAIRQEDGVPRFKLKTGTSDMNIVAPHWNVPAVAYGPGDSALDHTPDEHVEVHELRKATAVLGRVFTAMAQTPDSS